MKTGKVLLKLKVRTITNRTLTYTDLSNEEYHADKGSLSQVIQSKIFIVIHAITGAMHLDPERPIRKPTNEMILGSAFHTYILEPDKFGSLYGIEPPQVFFKRCWA